jgi:hypothetical protein
MVRRLLPEETMARGDAMKKFAIAGAILVGVGVLARIFAPKAAGVDWEQRFDSMPDSAPPKWIYRNIKAIRKNTERILELLEPSAAPEVPTGSSSSV